MTGTAVSWAIAAALVMVVSVAVWRLVRGGARRAAAAERADPLLHLLMALGMAVMLAPVGQWPRTPLQFGFAAMAIGSLAWAAAVRRGHLLHHAAVSAIMVLMARSDPAPMRGMVMTPNATGASLSLLAAFVYLAGAACVMAWRLPAQGVFTGHRSRGPCGFDGPLGRACEIVMLLGSALMLLPMI